VGFFIPRKRSPRQARRLSDINYRAKRVQSGKERHELCSWKSMDDYSTKKITPNLLEEIKQAIKNIRGWGTVEIVIQDYKVTQITEKNIKKTRSNLT